MSDEWYDFFDVNDVPMPDAERGPIAKTFEQSDPFAEEPDTTSEFHRAHTPQAADRLNREFMTHGVKASDAAYQRMDAEFRRLLEENGHGPERLRAVAREMIAEEEP